MPLKIHGSFEYRSREASSRDPGDPSVWIYRVIVAVGFLGALASIASWVW